LPSENLFSYYKDLLIPFWYFEHCKPVKRFGILPVTHLQVRSSNPSQHQRFSTTNIVEVCITVAEDVQDCLEFLSDMKELGYEKKYHPIIKNQIVAKVGQMKAIDPHRCQQLRIPDHLLLTHSKPQA
jgi:hypothetical protein